MKVAQKKKKKGGQLTKYFYSIQTGPSQPTDGIPSDDTIAENPPAHESEPQTKEPRRSERQRRSNPKYSREVFVKHFTE